MDREDFAERRRIGADYLARMARGSAEERRDLLLEWAVKLYDGHAGRRVVLLEQPGNIGQLVADLRLYYSGTIVPLLADARPDDFVSEAISLAIAGQESHWLARIALLAPVAAADQNSRRVVPRYLGSAPDPVAAERIAKVDSYIEEVFRIKKKRISRCDFWKSAGHRTPTAFERWQRNDPRSSKSDDRSFTRVLTRKPHLD